ncbi:MAG: altronate dehydratase family protein [Gemmatimonadaceae bacterium]|jgi:altronate hydrolase|nr:altronate dehydratase family protein [Gemmatimonadaceae bacterium]
MSDAHALWRVHGDDDVAVALRPLAAGEAVSLAGERIDTLEAVPQGHKLALRARAVGDVVHKYGFPIGVVTAPIARGQWVHEHNLATRLREGAAYTTHARTPWRAAPLGGPTWMGYRRGDGRVGTRNEIWIIPTVGCVNTTAQRIAAAAAVRAAGRVDGVHAFPHPFGCSQLGDDLSDTRRLLASLLTHPNAGGVLVLGLGCENNQMAALLDAAGTLPDGRVRWFNSQDVGDEQADGASAIDALIEIASGDRREAVPFGELLLGLKCGGSDGLSGITANPLLGRIAERLTACGGTAMLSEVPEMFGAEQLLMDRAVDEGTYAAVVQLIERFKAYFVAHGQAVYENPSPGNHAGGITTLEEKSLGAVQKGGQAPVVEVVPYARRARARAGGLALVEAPGNDAVSTAAMVAAGATMLLFTTGRGTPFGSLVPTLKVASNAAIVARKPHWFDVDASRALTEPGGLDGLVEAAIATIGTIASGAARAANERNDARELAIWKRGVTL